MDLSLLISTFLTVFLAELGDKTQLATVALSGTSDRPRRCFSAHHRPLFWPVSWVRWPVGRSPA